jgi:hypothetical protein
MQPLGAHGDLGSQPELGAVRKARAGIHVHGSRVYCADKTPGVLVILCEDAVRMVRAVLMDVQESRLQTWQDLQAKHQG